MACAKRLAVSGETAKFLAGGEFPIPVASTDKQITIAFKSFGVSTSFKPVVLDAGGGWGDPLERDPQAVARDVREELISVESARRDYGVVLGAGGAPDRESTARLRAAAKAGKAAEGKGL